jgi:hypothetical protein
MGPIRRRGLGVGELMAATMDDSDAPNRGDSALPLWKHLSAERRAEYINENVEKLIEESKVATKEIVADAMKSFEEDYAAIKSKSIRVSVLRNIGEEPLPVDSEESDEPIPGQLIPPPNRPVAQVGRSSFWFLFLSVLGF